MDERDRAAWERVARAFDAEVDARVRHAEARYKMKLSIAAYLLGSVILAADLAALKQIAAANPAGDLIHWWPVLATAGVMLMAFAALRAGFTGHKAAVAEKHAKIEAEMAQRVTLDTFNQFSQRMADRHAETLRVIDDRHGETLRRVDDLRDLILKRSA